MIIIKNKVKYSNIKILKFKNNITLNKIIFEISLTELKIYAIIDIKLKINIKKWKFPEKKSKKYHCQSKI
jgi:hypothetical protein